MGCQCQGGCKRLGGCREPLPNSLSHLLTCTGVVVHFISGRPHIADLPLTFHNAQLLLRGPRARHPHSWARLRLELCQERSSGMLVVPRVVLLAPPPASQAPRQPQTLLSHPWQPPWNMAESRMHRWVLRPWSAWWTRTHSFPSSSRSLGVPMGKHRGGRQGSGVYGHPQEPAPPYLLKVLVVKGDLGCP